MKIRQKLTLSFLVIIIAVIVTGYAGIQSFLSIGKNSLFIEHIYNLLSIQDEMEIVASEITLSSRITDLKKLESNLKDLERQLHQLFTLVEKEVFLREPKFIQELQSNHNNFVELSMKLKYQI